MKAVKNFLQLKVPDNSAYEQRIYTEQWHCEEDARVRYRRTGAACSVFALSLYCLSLHLHAHWTRRQEQVGWSSLWDSCFLPPSNETIPSSGNRGIDDINAEAARKLPHRPVQPTGQHDERTHLTCFQYIESE